VGLIVLFTVTMAYQNCAQYSDNPFNIESAATAPVSSPRLDIPTQQLEVSTSDDQMSFGSTCQWGLSSQHYLEFKLYTMSNRPVKVQSSATCNSSSSADCYRNITFRCEHGRYYAVLPVTCDSFDNALGAISYTLTGQMVTYDTNNNEVRDPQAYFSRQVLIDWNQAAATACGH
jgi:hypothetical protein